MLKSMNLKDYKIWDRIVPYKYKFYFITQI